MNRKFTLGRQLLMLLMLVLGTGGIMKGYGQYCTPPYTSGCTDDYIQSFSTTGGTTNISNLNSGSSSATSCFSNKTTLVHTATATTTVNFTILNCPGWGEGYKIFVDWNEDGDFLDAGEIVYNPTAIQAAGASATGSFVIPAGTTPGNKRLRVRCVFNTTTFDGCSSQSFGETEDYTLTVVPSAPCTNPATPGTIATSVPDSICPNVAFSLATTGTSLGSGMAYQWEQSATGAAGSWTNVTGATTLNYTVAGITANTYYRLKSTCSGGTAVFSNEKMVAVKSFISCYCTPVYTSGCTNGGTINGFSTTGAIANVSNLNTGCASGNLGYSNYSNFTVTAAQTFAFNFKVDISAFGSGVKIWADWNHDGVFDPTTELCAASAATIAAGSSYTGTITPPATALTGPTRIRVRAVESTTTFTPCSSQTWGEAEDYTINIVVPPACNTVTFPSNVHAIADPSALCVTGNVSLTIDSLMPPATGITYQWQTSPNGAAPWTNLGTATTTSSATATGVTATTYYRLQVLCTGTPVVTTSTDTVIVTNPGTVNAVNGQRCGPGQVQIGATPTIPASQVLWYTAATGGQSIGTGTPFNTPYITGTTTFYAAAGSGATNYATGKITPTSTSGNSGFSDVGLMFNALSPFTIQSVDVYPMSTTSTAGTITIALKNSAGTTLQSTTANVTVSAAGALNTVPLNFTVPAGTNYRLVVTAATGMTNLIRESGSGFAYPYNVTGVSSITSAYTGGASTAFYYYFYNWILKVGCESPRVAVTATVNAGPAATKSAPPVVCNNAVATLSITPPTPNPYTPYRWYPTTELYTDAAATIPYTGGSANTVYMKSAVAGQHTYYAIGGDTTAASTTCSRADTFNVWVQPGNVSITAAPDTICTSGSSLLSLNPNANYYTGSIQWQESLNGGATYTNITGATGVTYTTPTLTTNRFYRALISASSATCQQPVKQIVIANPTLISKTDSFNCGPGQVTLKAVTGGNSTAKWYENATGGSPIGSGSPWQTPFLTQTDTFWVVGGVGGAAPSSVAIGNGTTVSTGAVTPFYGVWGGYRHQFLITASELLAAGATMGATINSLAFDVVAPGSAGGTTYSGFAVSMGQTNATALTTATWIATTQVRNPANWTTAIGLNTLNFDVPFTWDGVSNIVVQTCWSNNNNSNPISTVRYHTTSFVATHYNNQDNVTPAVKCSNTGTGSTISQRPNMILGIKPCESAPRQMVIATIHPVPAPNLGPNIDTCIDQGDAITLNPGTIPNVPVYLWDNGATTATRDVTQTGVYNVKVTNQYGCVGRDTINVNMRWNPVVDLGANGTGLCLGGTKVLDAGTGGLSGGNYYWNTGATTRTITISNPGTYIAYVTSNQGCLTIDTVDITPSGYMPIVDGIVTQPLSANSFKFSALNPQNVTSFTWNFGDGSAPVTVPAGTSSVGLTNHLFTAGGTYNVTLKTYSVCGDIMDSTLVTIIGSTGINDIDRDAKLVQIYPNPNDGNILYIEAIGNVKVKEIAMYNVLGQEIYTLKSFDANTGKHKVVLPQRLASGVYNIRINTDKGMTTRKLEIVK